MSTTDTPRVRTLADMLQEAPNPAQQLPVPPGLFRDALVSLGAGLSKRFSVTDYPYLAYGDGVHDDTAAVQQAAADASAYALANGGAILYFPTGLYRITDTITINQYRVHVEGDGKYATTLTFNPSSARALFKAQMTNTALAIAQISFRRMGLTGGGTQQKIAFDLYDTSDCLLSEIVIASSWTGSTSIGIRTKGRELTRIKDVTIFADRPIHITRNTNAPSLSADHFHGTDMYLAPQVSTEASILLDGDVGLANFTLDGQQAWVGGKYGVFFQSGTVPATALWVRMSGFRFEQPADNTGYAVRWEGAAQNLLLDGNMGGLGATTNGGFYGRNIRKITLLNTLYTGGGASANALNVDSTCDELWLMNVSFQDLSTATISGLEEVFSIPKRNTNAPTPPTVYYANTTTGNRLVKINALANASLPAAGAANDRSIGIDTTNHRIVYYDGGVRYFIPIGTSF